MNCSFSPGLSPRNISEDTSYKPTRNPRTALEAFWFIPLVQELWFLSFVYSFRFLGNEKRFKTKSWTFALLLKCSCKHGIFIAYREKRHPSPVFLLDMSVFDVLSQVASCSKIIINLIHFCINFAYRVNTDYKLTTNLVPIIRYNKRK